MSRRLAAAPRRERAAAAVEMAIVLPLLLLIVGGIIDFGRFFYTQNIVVNAAREGARSRALGYTTADCGHPGQPVADRCAGRGEHERLLAGPGRRQHAHRQRELPDARPVPLDRQRVTVTVTGFTYIVLGPASRLFGGALTPPIPAGTAEMRCGG